MVFHWYALRSKAHKEHALYNQVVAQKVECFYPRVKVNPVNPRSAKARPYFPNYMFVHVDIERVGQSFFQRIPFSQGLVSYGEEPASVSDSLINALRKRIWEIDTKGGLKFDALKEGTPVRVVEGPFLGYEGIFDSCLGGEERVRVLLKLMRDRHMSVEMHVGQISIKKQT